MVAIEVLKQAEIFEGLSNDELRLIAEVGHEKQCEADDVFHREGDEVESLYFVRSGRVAVEVNLGLESHLPKGDFVVDRLQEGEAFGWSTLVEPYVSTATVRSYEGPCSVVAIDGAKLRQILDEHPRIGLVVFQAIASLVGRRLRHSWAQLAGRQAFAALSERYSYPGALSS